MFPFWLSDLIFNLTLSYRYHSPRTSFTAHKISLWNFKYRTSGYAQRSVSLGYGYEKNEKRRKIQKSKKTKSGQICFVYEVNINNQFFSNDLWSTHFNFSVRKMIFIWSIVAQLAGLFWVEIGLISYIAFQDNREFKTEDVGSFVNENPKILQIWGSLFYCIFYTVTITIWIPSCSWSGAPKPYVIFEVGNFTANVTFYT